MAELCITLCNSVICQFHKDNYARLGNFEYSMFNQQNINKFWQVTVLCVSFISQNCDTLLSRKKPSQGSLNTQCAFSVNKFWQAFVIINHYSIILMSKQSQQCKPVVLNSPFAQHCSNLHGLSNLLSIVYL